MTIINEDDMEQWGLVLAWYDEYTKGRGKKDYVAKINFLKEYSLKAFCISFSELDQMSEEDRNHFFNLLEENNMFVSPHCSFDNLTGTKSEIDDQIESVKQQIKKYIKSLRTPIVTATCGQSHRYDRVMSFSEKVKKFSYFFEPVAAACREEGAVLALENHADYYCSEIVEIIEETPDLFFLLDTANALHIGEQPVKAARDAAPYTVGTHFKDHYMVREDSPLHYEIRGCALGDGDAELEECYRILKENSPFGNKLIHFIELFKPEDLTAMECWHKSLHFIDELKEQYNGVNKFIAKEEK